jgi:hypothetical protein
MWPFSVEKCFDGSRRNLTALIIYVRPAVLIENSESAEKPKVL